MNQKVLAMNDDKIRAVLSYLAFYLSFCEEEEAIALERYILIILLRKQGIMGYL